MNRSDDGGSMVFLGFDTSNYRTSVAAVDEQGHILGNSRILLDVRPGQRGLRQSEALFQHVNNLPPLVSKVFEEIGDRRKEIRCVSVSTRPRPVEGSYMPVFNAGVSAGSMLADGLGVPLYHYSHQEGHIEAVRAGTRAQNMHRFVSFHLSGGTTEALLVDETPEGTTYRIIGGTRDISYGQLLDRVAVALGMQFPGGEEMDQIALHAEPAGIRLPRIKVQDGYFHLSGLESHCQRFIASEEPVHKIRDGLILALFQEIARSMSVMMDQLYSIEHVEGFLFAGGVASSQFIRQSLASREDVVFGDPALSGDNAVGIALLGGKEYGSETNQRLTTE